MGRSTATDEVFAGVLSHAPDVLAHLTAANRAATAAIDPRLYDLCRIRLATLLGSADTAVSDVVSDDTIHQLPSWPTSDAFTETERACLAFTEQFVIDVASLSDELAERVADRLGPEGFATFVNALLVIEQRERLPLVWSRLLPEEAR